MIRVAKNISVEVVFGKKIEKDKSLSLFLAGVLTTATNIYIIGKILTGAMIAVIAEKGIPV